MTRGFEKIGEFIHYLIDYWRFKKDSVRWRWLYPDSFSLWWIFLRAHTHAHTHKVGPVSVTSDTFIHVCMNRQIYSVCVYIYVYIYMYIYIYMCVCVCVCVCVCWNWRMLQNVQHQTAVVQTVRLFCDVSLCCKAKTWHSKRRKVFFFSALQRNILEDVNNSVSTGQNLAFLLLSGRPSSFSINTSFSNVKLHINMLTA
jgi:hypothetical protein